MQGSWMTNVRTFSYMNNIDKVKAAVCPFCVFKFLTAMPILCHVKFNKGKNKWYFDGKTWFCTESLIITQTDNIPYNTLYNESLSNSDLNKFFFIKIILSCLKSNTGHSTVLVQKKPWALKTWSGITLYKLSDLNHQTTTLAIQFPLNNFLG